MVDAYSVIGSPGSTLACPAYPSIASGAPKCLIGQSGSPACEFSLTVRRCAAGCAGPAGAFLPDPAIFAATAAPATPVTPRPRTARRERTERETMVVRMARESGGHGQGTPFLRHRVAALSVIFRRAARRRAPYLLQ